MAVWIDADANRFKWPKKPLASARDSSLLNISLENFIVVNYTSLLNGKCRAQSWAMAFDGYSWSRLLKGYL